jgi:hypothetical protein
MMYGEVLETAEGWSTNRGTPKDIQFSHSVNRWLDTPQGRQSLREVAQILQAMWNRDASLKGRQ